MRSSTSLRGCSWLSLLQGWSSSGSCTSDVLRASFLRSQVGFFACCSMRSPFRGRRAPRAEVRARMRKASREGQLRAKAQPSAAGRYSKPTGRRQDLRPKRSLRLPAKAAQAGQRSTASCLPSATGGSAVRQLSGFASPHRFELVDLDVVERSFRSSEPAAQAVSTIGGG